MWLEQPIVRKLCKAIIATGQGGEEYLGEKAVLHDLIGVCKAGYSTAKYCQVPRKLVG